MILAAGLSPAWQQILLFDQLQTGEVNRAREAHWCASGKVLNVAAAARSLTTTPVSVITPLGGLAGSQIQTEFHSLGIQLHIIPTKAPTRVCTTLLNQQTLETTELVENAHPLEPSEWEDYLHSFQQLAKSATHIVFTGSLPAGPPTDFLQRLFSSQLSADWILDIRGTDLLTALRFRPWLVKPNREELAATLAKELLTENDMIQAIREILHLGAQAALITRGKEPALLGFNSEIWEFQSPLVPTLNPIGCGDSLAAGIAASKAAGADLVTAVRFGIAAAAHNAELLLPARLSRPRTDELLSQVTATCKLQF